MIGLGQMSSSSSMPTPMSDYSITSLSRSSALSPPRFGRAGRPHSSSAGILITAFRRAPSTPAANRGSLATWIRATTRPRKPASPR